MMRSVTIYGVTYPSIAEAARQRGVTVASLRWEFNINGSRDKSNRYHREKWQCYSTRDDEKILKRMREYFHSTAIDVGVYRLTCTVSGNNYIGSTKRLSSRLSLHKNHMKNGIHHSQSLQEDYDQYGWDAFTFEVLERCSEDELLERERDWIYRERPVGNTKDPISAKRLPWAG